MLSIVKIVILIANFINLNKPIYNKFNRHPVQNKWELHAKNKICILYRFSENFWTNYTDNLIINLDQSQDIVTGNAYVSS